MGWTLERPFSADYFGLTTVSLHGLQALYLGLLIAGLRLGRAEVGSPPSGLRALTLAWLFDVFLW